MRRLVLAFSGWFVALLCAAGWSRAKRWEVVADGWEEAAIIWQIEAGRAHDLAERCQANAEAAVQLADDWKNTALLLNAALLEPSRGRQVQ